MMTNNYRIPAEVERAIRARDVACVYCGKKMIDPKSGGRRDDWATIDHLDYKPPFTYRGRQTADDFAISCWHCNCFLRRDKELSVWLLEEFGKKDGNISMRTIAPVIKKYLARNFMNRLEWKFAKTMPEIPHHYIVRDSLSDDDKKLFDICVEYINTDGYSGEFASKSYRYMDIDGYKYWTIDNILNREQAPRL